jgi:hypothetical protein
VEVASANRIVHVCTVAAMEIAVCQAARQISRQAVWVGRPFHGRRTTLSGGLLAPSPASLFGRLLCGSQASLPELVDQADDFSSE